VDVNTVSTLVALQQANPESAILSPLHLDATGCRLDRRFANHIGKSARIRELLSDVLLRREIEGIYPVGFINAAIWLLSRDCVSRVGLFNPAFDHYWEDNEYTERVHYHGLNVGLSPACRAYHERNQDSSPENFTIARYRLIVYATAQHRILRRMPGLWFNIASALSCILLSAPPINTSFAQAIFTKLGLVRRLLVNLPGMLRYRKRAYEGSQCFFQDAELDRQRFVTL
jgi:GT2 family glycosyltransferase